LALPQSMLMSDDLPTLDRPTKANSRHAQVGQAPMSAALSWKVADLIFMIARGADESAPARADQTPATHSRREPISQPCENAREKKSKNSQATDH